MILQSKFGGQSWFSYAALYLSSRFPSVESRLQTTFRYVELHSENRDTFSYEFSSILRDSGSIFGSVADALVRGVGALRKREYNFGHYRDFLLREIPDLYKRSVCLRPCFPAGIVVPFEELQTGSPKWWDAYNKAKHHDYLEFRMGNLENCLLAISGLALLAHLMGVFVSDPLFVNVGIAYPQDSIDMSNERRLFPRNSNTL